MIVCFVKIWRPPRQDIGSFEDWRKFGEFYQIGVALVISFLFTDFLRKQTKKKLKCDLGQ